MEKVESKTKKKNNKAKKTSKKSKDDEKEEKTESEPEEITLTDLSGVGPAIAEKLAESGFNSIEAIAVASPNQMAAETAIGEATCSKIIQSAREKMNIGFESAADVLEKRKNRSVFTTGSTQLDGLLNGGCETRAIIEVYGEFRTGKTQIAHQICVTVQLPQDKGGLNAAAIYIDAEGTFRPERLLQIAEKYPELNPEEVLDNVMYARAYNSDHQTIIIDKLPSMVREKNIKIVIVDSLISHFRAEYVGRGTLSERQQKLNRFMHKLLQLAEAHDLCVFITNQVMAAPGLFFGDPTTPVGGHVVAHASTYRMYLRKSKSNKRVARLVDSPCLPEGECVFVIDEHGISDP
ncbi:MAG: DNA repair and recombination protein RadA [Candidatus Lokiarchaeota archaeon]|nr:DNA repair and recombination protein RadA [Candidatus Lokiarchaeota archaeon]